MGFDVCWVDGVRFSRIGKQVGWLAQQSEDVKLVTINDDPFFTTDYMV